MQTTASTISYFDKQKFYHELHQELCGYLEDEWLMNMANFSALVKKHLPDVNWVGFYLLSEEELRLGPFQGMPACTRIPLGKGVCGTSAIERKTLLVDDVDLFPGHIVCDSASRSEIVVPVLLGDRLIGVLDIDAPVPARFDDADRIGLEMLIATLLDVTNFPARF